MSKNAVQNVRVLDEFSGTDGARVDRMLSSLQNSHSQIRVLCADCYRVDTALTASSAIIGSSQFRLTDDFVSFASQFETFRVAAVRFDIYDVNPSNAASGFFGTFHDEYTSSTQPVFSTAAVVDSADGQIVPPGTGKLSLTWLPKGTRENDFVAVGTSPGTDFGGLRYAVNSASAAGRKYEVYFKALIDFRGRL